MPAGRLGAYAFSCLLLTAAVELYAAPCRSTIYRTCAVVRYITVVVTASAAGVLRAQYFAHTSINQ